MYRLFVVFFGAWKYKSPFTSVICKTGALFGFQDNTGLEQPKGE